MIRNHFGKAVLIARIANDISMSEMAKALGLTSSFLSSIESGRKKISDDLCKRIDDFFKDLGYVFPTPLAELAAMSNGVVSLDGLSLRHKYLVVKLAQKQITEEYDLARIGGLLDSI